MGIVNPYRFKKGPSLDKNGAYWWNGAGDSTQAYFRFSTLFSENWNKLTWVSRIEVQDGTILGTGNAQQYFRIWNIGSEPRLGYRYRNSFNNAWTTYYFASGYLTYGQDQDIAVFQEFDTVTDDLTMRYYVDGVLRDTHTIPYYPNGSGPDTNSHYMTNTNSARDYRSLFNRYNGGTNEQFRGKMEYFGLWTSELALSEINDIQDNRDISGNIINCYMFFKMEEDPSGGVTAANYIEFDSSGNNKAVAFYGILLTRLQDPSLYSWARNVGYSDDINFDIVSRDEANTTLDNKGNPLQYTP